MSAVDEPEVRIHLRVNGQPVSCRVEPRVHLVDFLRDELGLTGSRVGCEHGVCGACTVQVDGRIVRGCLTLAVQAEAADVWTLEGLSERGDLAALQQAFHRRNAVQCGFCTAGMLLTAHELVSQQPRCGREAIREHLSGNLCRCTGYQSIVDAVEEVCAAAHGEEAA